MWATPTSQNQSAEVVMLTAPFAIACRPSWRLADGPASRRRSGHAHPSPSSQPRLAQLQAVSVDRTPRVWHCGFIVCAMIDARPGVGLRAMCRVMWHGVGCDGPSRRCDSICVNSPVAAEGVETAMLLARPRSLARGVWRGLSGWRAVFPRFPIALTPPLSSLAHPHPPCHHHPPLLSPTLFPIHSTGLHARYNFASSRAGLRPPFWLRATRDNQNGAIIRGGRMS